jgi:hypothetical protein
MRALVVTLCMLTAWVLVLFAVVCKCEMMLVRAARRRLSAR